MKVRVPGTVRWAVAPGGPRSVKKANRAGCGPSSNFAGAMRA